MASSLAKTEVPEPAVEQRSVVVVGNGMVGHRFCELFTNAARSHEAEAGKRVLVLGEEATAAYDRVHLGGVLSGEPAASLSLAPPEWYDARNIDLALGDPVVELDTETKQITTRSGRRVAYERLILCTGAEPRKPPVRGLDSPGVFVYRSLSDVSRIRAAGSGARVALVLGGGLLGIEAAKGLRDMGVDVHLVEAARFLMPRQLDEHGGELVAMAVARFGIHITTGVLLKELAYEAAAKPSKTPSDAASGTSSSKSGAFPYRAVFEDGHHIDADMVVVAAGVRPRDDLARQAGIACGVRGGVIVNDGLETSAPGVYALGDCSMFEGQVPGLVAPGYQMATVLAARLQGDTAKIFKGVDASARLKLAGVEVSVQGPQGDYGTEDVIYSDDRNYRKLMVSRGQVRAALSVGTFPERDRVQALIDRPRFLFRWQFDRFARQGRLWRDDGLSNDVSALPDAATICQCMGIDCGTLRQARADGHTTVDELVQATRASTVCGTCRPQVESIAGGVSSAIRLVSKVLAVASIVAALAATIHFLAQPLPFAQSVQGFSFDVLWRSGLARQISGYSLLGLSLIGLLMALRKRLSWFSFGRYQSWRVLHVVLGALVAVGLVVHTGFAWPRNLNQALLIDFLAVNLGGAVAGLVFSLSASARTAIWQRRMRWVHTLTFWPFPVLVAFHVASYYYFS